MPDRFPAYAVMTLPFLLGGHAACGGDAVPQVVVIDASLPVDGNPVEPAPDAMVCACPGHEPLSKDHLVDAWEITSTSGSQGRTCSNPGDFLLTGSCVYDAPFSVEELGTIGFQTFDQVVYWICGHTYVIDPSALQHGTRCITSLPAEAQPPASCECPEIETPGDRLFYVEQLGTVLKGLSLNVEVTCPEGSLLVSGGCTAFATSDGTTDLASAGSLPAAPQTWTCSFRNTSTSGDRSVKANAVCLNPTIDAITSEVVSEDIEYVFEPGVLPADTLHIVEATCPVGEILVAGGCRLEDVQDVAIGINIVRDGLHQPADNRPNTWQCGWRNDTATTPAVLAMAVCLDPTPTAAPPNP
jgi:hypothetical protein